MATFVTGGKSTEIVLGMDKILENGECLGDLDDFSECTLYPKCIQNLTMDEKILWKAINMFDAVLLSGPAGSGKSHLMKLYKSQLDRLACVNYLTAPTGVAATNCGGETIYRAISLGLFRDDPHTIYKRMSKNRNSFEKTKRFLSCDYLIIDEISMLDPEFWNKMDMLMRLYRGNSTPFGGCKIVMVGDFCQLGPIKRDSDLDKADFVFETEPWTRFNMMRIRLDRSYRQKGDMKFFDLCNRIRLGVCTQEDVELLESRVGVYTSIEAEEHTKIPEIDSDQEDEIETDKCDPSKPKLPAVMKIDPIDLFPRRAGVDNKNSYKLKQTSESRNQPIQETRPYYSYEKRKYAKKLDTADERTCKKYVADKSKLHSMFPVSIVRLCVGAQVMMRCNKFIDEGVYNGSLGIVTSCNQHAIHVRFEVKGKFMKQDIEITKYKFESPVGRTGQVYMFQFPLSLAFASTIHKCQSLTLSRARISAANCFAPGQFYVAISRVCNLNDLSFISFDKRSIMANDKAVFFETRKTVDEHKEALGGIAIPRKRAKDLSNIDSEMSASSRKRYTQINIVTSGGGGLIL